MADRPGPDNRWGRLYIQRVRDIPIMFEICAATRSRQRGQVLAYARASVGNPWRRVTYFADAERTTVLWTTQAHYPWLAKNAYTIKSPVDGTLGVYDKDFGKSFGNATFNLSTITGIEAAGRDQNLALNRARRTLDFAAQVTYVFQLPNGREVLRVERGWGKQDPYLVDIPKIDERQIDWRVAASVAVSMDISLNRA